MRAALRAGIAVYNAGEYHAAHDAWEAHWLDLPEGSDDERFLHGLIQFTAALHHARESNWEGLAGLVESAGEYLAGLPDEYRGVNVGDVRAYLDALDGDPEHVERVAPPALTHGGAAVGLDDLGFEAAAVAAEALAEEGGYEEAPVERAVEYAREAVEAGETNRFVALVMDFAAAAENRELIYRRLVRHVERRTAEERDVEGLFDAGNGVEEPADPDDDVEEPIDPDDDIEEPADPG